MNDHRKTAVPSFSSSPFRRRRITWCILITFVLVLYFGAPWEMPGYLKDVDHSSGISRANIAKLVKPPPPSTDNDTSTSTSTGKSSVDEIYGLLHLVISGGDQQLSHDVKVTSDKPVEMKYYAGVDREVNWEEEVKELNAKYPIVVFSKTYCPYSKKAKRLLAKYGLEPAPKVIEVDLRDDSDLIKLILLRLTGRGTFPNILVRGRSIGGSDDIEGLHADGKLRQMLEGDGVAVKGDT